ncbi:hypothetical protein VKT23_001197 [Stygiomarasmius scandens]|uniref:F-box domain-containing protein n=1 Tax=Marasmiellus scandens TaxID=2682957 RepID=A0ABR1K7E1_9AGAR
MSPGTISSDSPSISGMGNCCFDRLPDELVSVIAGLCVGREPYLRISVTRRQRFEEPPSAVNHLSLVDKRFRQITLPILFCCVKFSFCRGYRPQGAVNPQEPLDFQQRLKQYAHTAQFIRHVKFTTYYISGSQSNQIQILAFVSDVIRTCPKLERLELLRLHDSELEKDYVSSFLAAFNEHPNPNFRAVISRSYDHRTLPTTISLSRITFRCLDSVDTYLLDLLRRGVHVEEVSFCAEGCHRWTYPGLRSINKWEIVISPQMFHEFVSRHPLLDIVTVPEDMPLLVHESFPWSTKALSDVLSHYACTLGTTTAVRQKTAEWQIDSTSVSLMVSSSEELPDMLISLGKAFPGLHHIKLEVNLKSGDEFGLVLDTSDLINLLATSFSKAWSIHLGQFVLTNLIRTWQPHVVLGSHVYSFSEVVTQACLPFCKALAQLPHLRKIGLVVPPDLVSEEDYATFQVNRQVRENGGVDIEIEQEDPSQWLSAEDLREERNYS